MQEPSFVKDRFEIDTMNLEDMIEVQAVLRKKLVREGQMCQLFVTAFLSDATSFDISLLPPESVQFELTSQAANSLSIERVEKSGKIETFYQFKVFLW